MLHRLLLQLLNFHLPQAVPLAFWERMAEDGWRASSPRWCDISPSHSSAVHSSPSPAFQLCSVDAWSPILSVIPSSPSQSLNQFPEIPHPPFPPSPTTHRVHSSPTAFVELTPVAGTTPYGGQQIHTATCNSLTAVAAPHRGSADLCSAVTVTALTTTAWSCVRAGPGWTWGKV